MPASNFAAPFILVGRRVRARVVGGYMSVRVRLVCGLLLFVSCEGGKDVRHIKLPSTLDHLQVRRVRTFQEDINAAVSDHNY